jgi:ElaB/YqjD/DUF883 family membrane-anchored ribosome-binding protein
MDPDDLKKIREDLEDLRSRLMKASGDAKEEIGERAEDFSNLAKARAREMAMKMKMASKRADRYARENPWTLAAIGMGVGFILGVILFKPKRDHGYLE